MNRQTIRIKSSDGVHRNTATDTFTVTNAEGQTVAITAKAFLAMQAVREEQLNRAAAGKAFAALNGGA